MLFCFFPVQDFALSLSSTVLMASWNAPSGQNLDFYIFNCFVNSQEVLSVNTTQTSLVLGIYEPITTYVCSVRYTTTSGVSGPASNNISVTTEGKNGETCNDPWHSTTYK